MIKFKWLRQLICIGTLFMLFANVPATTAFAQDQVAVSQPALALAAVPQGGGGRPPAFMHRPYYGTQTILRRAISFLDHDKPWYEYDGTFVRFDGYRVRDTMYNCSPHVSCYDGHNGYDLNLWFEPVLSTAAGRVLRAGWYNYLNHNAGLGLWVAIDHGNGFITAYGHLSSLLVAVGDTVGVQWQIGTSGTTGASTGPHLHMATYYLPTWQATDPFGWTGHYRDPNVVPDNYLWVTPPGTRTTVPYLSGNGKAVYSGGILVDDGAPGWISTGVWSQARNRADINGNLRWARTSVFGTTASASWRPTLPADGDYEVGVFVDAAYATSGWVPYTIYSSSPNNPAAVVQHTVYVDESHIGTYHSPFGNVVTGPQWISLGTYYFRRAQNGRVVVSNATGEHGLQVAADGVEFVPARAGYYWTGGKGAYIGGEGEQALPQNAGSLAPIAPSADTP